MNGLGIFDSHLSLKFMIMTFMKPYFPLSMLISMCTLLFFTPNKHYGQTYANSFVRFQDTGYPTHLYTFYAAATGQLYSRYFNGRTWRWANQGNPPYTRFSSVSIPSVISYRQGSQPRRIHAFAVGNYTRLGQTGPNGISYLYRNYWDGYRWHWQNQGNPTNGRESLNAEASVVTYGASNLSQYWYAFVTASDGHLYANHWNGFRWSWEDRGTPPSTTCWGSPASINFPGTNLREEIHTFVIGTSGKLYTNYLDLSSWFGRGTWRWQALGQPSNTRVIGTPRVITYIDRNGTRRIYVFMIGEDKNLYTCYRVGSGSWRWANQGKPNVNLRGLPSVVTYKDNRIGKQRIYIFNLGDDENLYVNFWDGTRWQWANQGKARNARLISSVRAVSYKDEANREQIFAFVEAGRGGLATGELYANHWDGGKWEWVDQEWGLFRGSRSQSIVSSQEELPPHSTAFANIFEPELKVYPNPFSSQMTIEGVAEVQQVRLISPTGQLIYPQMNISEGKVELNMEELPANVYTLTIDTDQGTITHRVMKSE